MDAETDGEHTDNQDHYYRMLTMLAVLAMPIGSGAKPAHASTTFVVNSTSDLGDPNPNDAQCIISDFAGVDHCTLRAALQNANGTPGADTTEFAIGLRTWDHLFCYSWISAFAGTTGE